MTYKVMLLYHSERAHATSSFFEIPFVTQYEKQPLEKRVPAALKFRGGGLFLRLTLRRVFNMLYTSFMP